MKAINQPSARYQAFAIAILFFLNCTYCPYSEAHVIDNLDYSDLTKLSSLETTIYGSSYKNLPSDKRIGSLEKIIFGKVHNGPLHPRIVALANSISGQQNNVLSPPIAPELDRTDTATNTPVPPIAPTLNSSDLLSATDAQEDRVKNMLQQAMQLYAQGQTPEAEIIFKKVLKLDSQNTDANFNLGVIAEGKSDYQAALHYYQTALKGNPDDSDIKSAISHMQAKIATVNKNASKSAENSIQKLSPAQVEALKAKVGQAASNYQAGNYDAAINNLKAVLAQTPDQADVYYALAQAYKAKGELSNASAALNQAIKFAPNNEQYKEAFNEIASSSSGQREQPSTPATDSFSTNSPNTASNSGKPKKNKSDWQEDNLANQNNNGSNNNGQIGDITPFSDEGNNQLGWQATPAYTADSSYYMPSSRLPGYTYSNYIPYSMSAGMERAAIMGITGAAIGMFAGSMMMHGRGRR